MSKLRVLSLFAGIGGFDLGLERTGGFKSVRLVEQKPHAQAVLAKNFPGVRCDDDVTTCEYEEGEVDVIAAGFPCQDLSLQGVGAGLSGARSGLYREVIRAIRLVRPAYTILENVAALLSRGMGTVLGDVAEIGCDAEWHCIPASAVGARQGRDRVWIVAHPEHRGVSIRRGTPDVGEALLGPERIFRHEPQGSEQQKTTLVGSRREGVERQFASPWAVEPRVDRVANGVPHRVDRLAETGNAVVPQIPEIIGRAILKSIERNA